MARIYRQKDRDVDLEFLEVDKRISALEGFEIPVGGMLLWASKTLSPPNNYLKCDGQSYSTKTYPELFRILQRDGGTPTPDTEENFMVPNLTQSGFHYIVRYR